MDKDKETKILEVAETVFAEKGFHATKVDEIASRAGVAKGTVYLYFKSKEHLFFRTIEFMIRGMIEAIKQKISALDDPLDRLKEGVRVYFEYISRHKKIFFMVLNEEIASSGKGFDDKSKKKHIELYRRSQQFIMELMQECIDAGYLKPFNPIWLTSALSGLLQKMVVNSIVFNIELRPDEMFGIATDLFLNGAMLRKEVKQ